MFSESTHLPMDRVYALRALLTSLSPLIGAESELGNRAVSSGWADDISQEKMTELRKKGTELVADEMEKVIQHHFAEEYGRLMRKVSLCCSRTL
jgi:hypothetical protein